MNIGKHKKLLWTIVITFILGGVLVGYWRGNPLSISGCLLPSEKSSFQIHNKQADKGEAVISVIDQSGEIREFKIEIPIVDHYHPIELHKCGVYSFHSMNYDYKSRKALPGYSFSLWKYDYSGGGEEVVRIAEVENEVPKILFNTDFRVSPDENYLVLAQGNAFEDDYNIVIESLSGFRTNNLKNVLKVSFKDIAGSNPNIYGSIGFNEWSSDSRYFWGNIFDGADVKAYYKIDIQDGSLDVFEAPFGSLGGDALVLNPNNGYVPYDPNAYWSPDADDMAIRTAINQGDGLKSELHLRHLPTGKDILVASVDEPLWRFLPKWISDTELEYTLPSGAKKTFVIPL